MTAEAVDAFDQASLEAFTATLVAAGFEPVPATGRRWWRSPIHPAFAPLTQARQMHLYIADGWPLTPPALIVDGLAANHATLDGLVCLWRDDDASMRWQTWAGLEQRIVEWCRDAQHGWAEADLARDAYLNFSAKHPAMATFDLNALVPHDGGTSGAFNAAVVHPFLVALTPGHTGDHRRLVGMWLAAGGLPLPPRALEELPRCLNRPQARRLQRALEARRDTKYLEVSGGVDLILLCWQRGERRDLLVLAVEGKGNTMTAKALQTGPQDEATLLLRAGPDAPALSDKTVVVVGLGALGGHVALTLAESGLGRLVLVDPELLAPGNVVRHVAGKDQIGYPKAMAVEQAIAGHAPWTTVTTDVDPSTTPARLSALIAGADVVVDATGNAAVTLAYAHVAAAADVILVAGALYRGGAVARVRRQGAPGDTLIAARSADPRYAIIPPAADGSEYTSPEVGCSAPVNNAPPASVTAGAALITQAAIDSLTGRHQLADEVIEIYRALPGEAPFDRLGRLEA